MNRKQRIIRNKLRKVWRSKWNILSGLINYIFRKVRVEKIARERIAICKSNVCGFYDKDGSSEKSIGNLGQPSCGCCGCILKIKARCLEVNCALEDIEKTPLWFKV